MVKTCKFLGLIGKIKPLFERKQAMEDVNKIISFMRILEKVCVVKRDNLMFDGTPDYDGFHIFKLAFLVLMIKPYLKNEADYTKMLELALVHDIAEALAGDYPLAQQMQHPNLRIEKKKKEQEAINYYKTILPPPLNQKVFDLFMEYEERSSLEAKIVAVLDKLEANLQANQFQDGNVTYWGECENGAEYYKLATRYKSQIKDLDDDFLLKLEAAIVEISKENIKKCNIKI